MTKKQLISRFLEQFPKMEEQVDTYKAVGSDLMEIHYTDGSVGVFDSVLSTFRYIPVGTNRVMTEHRWQLELGQSIYRTMIAKGLLMCDLSEMSGVSYSQLSKYINGHKTPNSYTLKRIASALGVEVGELTNFERYYK